MKNTRITFIGAGNMARSLIGGLIADGWAPSSIAAADPDQQRLTALQGNFPIRTGTDNNELIADSEVIVLAVKPQIIKEVATSVAATVQATRPLIISVAAGIRSADLDRWLGGKCALVRCMPNTPALVQSGATALTASSSVTDSQKDLAESILRAVGLALWLDDETQMDAVTALSGSGPAYFLLLMETLQEVGENLGLPHDKARLLVLQTAFGAAKMALESSEEAAVLRQRVTSPGGTTEQALGVLENGGFRALLNDALNAARNRSRELANQFGAE